MNKQKIAKKHYLQAFRQAVPTTSSEMKVQKGTYGYKVKVGEFVYEIVSQSEMEQIFDDYLYSPESAGIFIRSELWIPVAEGVHFETAFITHLLSLLDEEEKKEYAAIVPITTFAADPCEAFWTALEDSTCNMLYGKAVHSAYQVWNKEVIIEELIEEHLETESFCEMNGGICEQIAVEHDEHVLDFYVYSLEPGKWETNMSDKDTAQV